MDRPLAALFYRNLKIAAVALLTTLVTCVEYEPPTSVEPGIRPEVLAASTITHTLLTAGKSATTQRTYTTASISPASNALITVAVLMERSSGVRTPTISGGGMSTWTLVSSVDFATASSPDMRLMIYRAMSANPGTGTIKITFSSSADNAMWIVSQWVGVETGGTNGSAAIVQTGSQRSDGATNLTVPLAAFASANDVAYGVVGVERNGPTVSPGSGFAEISEQSSGEASDLQAEWATNQPTVRASWSTSVRAGMLGVEIKAGSGGGGVSPSLSTVSADPTSIAAGSGTSTITVTAKDGSGNPVSGATVELTATGTGTTLTQPPAATDANGLATGTITSTDSGTKTVTARIDGTTITQTATVTVTVTPPTVSAALSTVSADPTSIAAGSGTSTITVTAKDGSGNPVSGATVELTATGTGTTLTQPPAATDANGLATGTITSTDSGTKTVTARIDGTTITQTATVTVTVTPPTVSAALSTVSADPTSIAAGSGTSTITVTAKDGSGNPVSGATVELTATGTGTTLTQPPAATDANGLATGTITSTAPGTKTVTARIDGTTITQTATVTVTPGPVSAAQSTVAASPTSVAPFATSTITVTAKDAGGNPISGATVTLAATGMANVTQPAVPTDANGVASGSVSSHMEGMLTVSATINGIAITQTVTVNVVAQATAPITQTLLTSGHDVNNVRIYTTASIAPAPNALVTVAVLTHQSSSAAPAPTLTGGGMAAWALVATVAYNGATPLDRVSIFRAMSASPGSGPITITSSATVSNCQWIVSQWEGVETTGTNGAGAIVQTGSSTGAAVTGLTVSLAGFADPADVAYGAFGIASSSAIATAGSGFTAIDQQLSGESTVGDLFAERAVNDNTIDATWSSNNAGALGVEIKAGNAGPVVPVALVEVTPASSSIPPGGTVQLTATTKDAQGNILTGRIITWAADASGVATVSSTGLVTGLAAGTATITATSEGIIGSASVSTVVVPVASVEVSPATADVSVGNTAQLTATLMDAAGEPLNGRTITWLSDAPQFATVSSTGLVTGVAIGAATISATSEGISGSASVTVTSNSSAVASVEVTPASSSIPLGGTVQLTATTKDGQGNILTGRSITWGASGAATVSATGLVTGVGAGTATIIAMSEGITGSASVSVTAGGAATLGQWSAVLASPIILVHQHLLLNGRVLIFGGTSEIPQVFDPATGLFTAKPISEIMFCSGHSWLPDGRLLVSGGGSGNGLGHFNTDIFDPATASWITGPNMAYARWYPTVTTMPNGEVVTIGGADENGTAVRIPEIGNGTSWRSLTGASLSLPNYPRNFVAPDGRLFAAGPMRQAQWLNVSGAGSWTAGPSMNFGSRSYGSAVMYEAGKILFVGGNSSPTNTAEIIDLNQANPVWAYTDPMARARWNLNATVLPDGQVLVTGGVSGDRSNASLKVNVTEMWNPATGAWTTLASSASLLRGYHSTTLLLPDGRLIHGGGGAGGGTVDNFSYEVYSPPYLFRGARPGVTGVTGTPGYGQVLTVQTPNGASITKVTLIRFGSVTHAFDEAQQLVSLTFSQTADGISVNLPSSRNIAPPGPYMLFLVNNAGVPSIGQILRLQ